MNSPYDTDLHIQNGILVKYRGPGGDVTVPAGVRAIGDGFLFALQVDLPEMAPWQDSYLAYVQQEYAACEKKAWKDEPMLRLLMEQRLLKPETARNMLKKFFAAKRADLVSALSAYLGTLCLKFGLHFAPPS